ncbi:MAG: hypothetical protein ACRCR2_02310 [Fusobacteriaceae bacterium]
MAVSPQADAGFMSGIFNRQSMFGGQGSTGWVSPVLGGVGALAQGWMGMQQLKLGKENLAFQKDAWQKNYQNQVDMINTQMRDRQAARYSANPQQYQKPDEYMAENKVGR